MVGSGYRNTITVDIYTLFIYYTSSLCGINDDDMHMNASLLQ